MNFPNNGKIAEKDRVVRITNKNTGELLELRAASGGTDDNSVMTRKDVLELLAALQVAEPKPTLTEPKPKTKIKTKP